MTGAAEHRNAHLCRNRAAAGAGVRRSAPGGGAAGRARSPHRQVRQRARRRPGATVRGRADALGGLAIAALRAVGSEARLTNILHLQTVRS